MKGALLLSRKTLVSALMRRFSLLKFHFILLTCFMQIPGIVLSQNLVANGDFETYSSCPTDASQLFLAPPWFNPSTDTAKATPDYFNACLVTPCKVGVPSNKNGNSLDAHSGSGYAGIIVYYRKPPAIDTSSREYISVPLSYPLNAGIQYTVSFYVRKPSTSGHATPLGAHLSAGSMIQNGIYAFNITPNVTETSILTDTNWTLVTATHIANGNETHLTIGNFRNDAGTSLLSNLGLPNSCPFTTTQWLAYYLIDDVSVTGGGEPTSAGHTLQAGNDAIKLFPNPFSAQLTFRLTSNEPTTIILYNIYSQQILQQTFTNTTVINTEQLADGIYFYELRNNKGTIKNGKVSKH